MDTNQLAEALARAVEAAKPAAEYCLLATQDHWWTVCMTKAEWSGWMQAIGAVIALGVAMSLPYIQARSAHIKNYRMAKNCLLHQCGSIRAIGVFVRINDDSIAALKRGRETIDTVVQTYEEVRPSDLPKGALPSWLGARTSANQFRQTVEEACQPGHTDIDVKSVIGVYSKAAESYLSEFIKFDPSIVAAIKRRFVR